MLAPLLLGLGTLINTASADPQQIRYDSYADDGDMLYGGYFAGKEGLGKNSCMAQVYSFEPEHFPLMPTGMKLFWGGEGAGVTSEALMTIYIDWYEGEADADTMQAGLYQRLEQQTILVNGTDIEGTWQDLDFAQEGMTFDFEPDVDGDQPITFGSLIVQICYDNVQALPEIAMDTNGFADEPLPENDDDFIVGHETSQFRNLIYWNGLWETLQDYLMAEFGFSAATDGGGDFIMRLNIDAQYQAAGQDIGCQASDDWNVTSITPNVATEGQITGVNIGGDYNFPERSKVTLGSYDLTVSRVNNDCGIEADVTKDIPAGDYDVVVEDLSDGSQMTLENGFTIEAADEGCGCATQGDSRALWWLPLIAAGLIVRRRD